MRKLKDLTGKIFGSWAVIKAAGLSKSKKRLWLCQCTCGNTSLIPTSNLIGGLSTRCKPCGAKVAGEARITTAPYKGTPIYNSWANMLSRCNNPNGPDYHNYGGRGISVCPQWRDFLTFNSDMAPHPGNGYSIDRINNDLGYSPDNCRWATKQQQGSNTRRTQKISHKGETKSIRAWAAHYNIPYGRLLKRIRYYNMTLEEAVSTQLYTHRNTPIVTYKGETLRLVDWADKTGISYTALHHRYNRGWNTKRMLTTPLRNPNSEH